MSFGHLLCYDTLRTFDYVKPKLCCRRSCETGKSKVVTLQRVQVEETVKRNSSERQKKSTWVYFLIRLRKQQQNEALQL